MSTGSDVDSGATVTADDAENDPRALVEKARRDGRISFLGVHLHVAPGALVPRPETELLGRTALEALANMSPRADGTLRIIDMCCGSGNLACALAAANPRLRVLAADLTDDCVALARRNVAEVGVQDRVRVYQGDLFAALPAGETTGCIDMIVCNPPYISTGRLGKDRAVLLEREPAEAFDGGPYGISIHQRVIKDAASVLRADGRLLFEFGLGQERQLRLLFNRTDTFSDVLFVADAGNRPRVAMATRTQLSHQKDSTP
jgi:release factor glutamine methyltransferase